MEKEGYKQASIPEALYNELQAEAEEKRKHPGIAQKPVSPTNCTLVIIVYPGGKIVTRCGGSCGIIDRFLGRSCEKQGTNPFNEFCTCTGGWFDRIFG